MGRAGDGDGFGCGGAILLGVGLLGLLSLFSSRGCFHAEQKPDPITVHRQGCMRCAKIDEKLFRIESLVRQTTGLHMDSTTICPACKEGLHEVFVVNQMIGEAREAGCIGLEEHIRDANKAQDSLLSTSRWYRCK